MSIVILQQGVSLLRGAWGGLTDAGVSSKIRKSLVKLLDPLISSTPSPSASSRHSIIAVRHLRARRAGSLLFVDLTADVSSTLSIQEASSLEENISQILKDARKELAEVRVRFNPVVPNILHDHE